MLPHAVVVAGDDAGPPARVFAEQAGLPLLAEPSSGARNGENALITYRLLLEHTPMGRQIDQVVVFGHPTLSRPVTNLLARDDIDVVVPARDLRGFPHPPGHARLVDPDVAPDGMAPPTWLDSWRTADAMASAAIDLVAAGDPPVPRWRSPVPSMPPCPRGGSWWWARRTRSATSTSSRARTRWGSGAW